MIVHIFVQDQMLTKEEILQNWNMFVGSQATNYGEDLTKNHDELWTQYSQGQSVHFYLHTNVECGHYRVPMNYDDANHKTLLGCKIPGLSPGVTDGSADFSSTSVLLSVLLFLSELETLTASLFVFYR